MTALVLFSGNLQKSAEQKTSVNGKPYTTANIRVKAGETQHFCVFGTEVQRAAFGPALDLAAR